MMVDDSDRGGKEVVDLLIKEFTQLKKINGKLVAENLSLRDDVRGFSNQIDLLNGRIQTSIQQHQDVCNQLSLSEQKNVELVEQNEKQAGILKYFNIDSNGQFDFELMQEFQNKALVHYQQVNQQLQDTIETVKKELNQHMHHMYSVEQSKLEMQTEIADLRHERDQKNVQIAEISRAQDQKSTLEKENKVLKYKVQDLSTQLRGCLMQLRGVEMGGVENRGADVNNTSSQDVISNNLVSIKSVKDLQDRNIELLATLRQVTDDFEQRDLEYQNQLKALELKLAQQEVQQNVEIGHDSHLQVGQQSQLQSQTLKDNVHEEIEDDAQLDMLQDRHDSMKAEFKEQIQELTDDLCRVESDLQQMKLKQSQLQHDKQKLSREYEKLIVDRNSLKKQLSDSQHSLEQKEQTIADQSKQLGSTQKKNQDLIGEIEDLQQEVADHQTQFQSKEVEVLSLKSEIEQLEYNLKIKEDELLGSKSQLSDLQQLLKQKEDQIVQINTQVSSLKSQIQEVTSSNDQFRSELDRQNAEYDGKVNNLQSELQKSLIQCNEKDQQLVGVQKDLLDKTEDYETLEQEVDSLRSQIDKVTKELQQSEGRLKVTNKELDDKSLKLLQLEADSQKSKQEIIELKQKISMLETEASKRLQLQSDTVAGGNNSNLTRVQQEDPGSKAEPQSSSSVFSKKIDFEAFANFGKPQPVKEAPTQQQTMKKGRQLSKDKSATTKNQMATSSGVLWGNSAPLQLPNLSLPTWSTPQTSNQSSSIFGSSLQMPATQVPSSISLGEQQPASILPYSVGEDVEVNAKQLLTAQESGKSKRTINQVDENSAANAFEGKKFKAEDKSSPPVVIEPDNGDKNKAIQKERDQEVEESINSVSVVDVEQAVPTTINVDAQSQSDVAAVQSESTHTISQSTTIDEFLADLESPQIQELEPQQEDQNDAPKQVQDLKESVNEAEVDDEEGAVTETEDDLPDVKQILKQNFDPQVSQSQSTESDDKKKPDVIVTSSGNKIQRITFDDFSAGKTQKTKEVPSQDGKSNSRLSGGGGDQTRSLSQSGKRKSFSPSQNKRGGARRGGFSGKKR
ncbi:hypothetical protein MIR68_007636 [Amoeboaphelidium protococcarum]|nr:hypothetical protein MIR68_007636 [Amoeboaphelidium protococcarum]